MVQYAEDGSSTIQFELGQMFQRSEDKTRNYKQAVKWYELSAKQGYRSAQHRLGSMYARGQGVAKNYIKAYAWYKVSASQHSLNALLKLKKIEPHMSVDQISYARKLSRIYYGMYVAH